ncbi:hypothetical protein Zmor_004782 [Zophobas morio]|uniref:Uncharacterized protein n=1 Tax=Zophobas morio TaxID=2755281 RepID=A0AA38INJ7_9CUCU|nr:hypothetical protein Zmor_004782 [Zophobas morio]
MKYVLLRNKPIRCLDTTPMGFFETFLVSTAMMDDSSSVTVAGRRSLKKRLERVAGSFDCGLQKNFEAAFANHPKEYMGLHKGDLWERGSLSQRVQ